MVKQGKYFNNDEKFGRHSFSTLRVIEGNDGFLIMKGGIISSKGKLAQAEVMAFCKTKEEAEELLEKMINL